MADKHTAAFWAGGAALIAVGGIFMGVTGFEPTKKRGSSGTPSCTVVIKDELGNEYRATLPKREPHN